MARIIKSMEDKYLLPSLELVQQVFTQHDCAQEGRLVRHLVEEIRALPSYLPELELLMVDETDAILGYVMFSGFHLEGRYKNELLILTPCAVRTDVQRRHISRDLIEHGFRKAADMGYKAVIVEGDPRNYNPRGFVTAADHGILPGETVHLPHISCLMIKELVPGALENIHGKVEYTDYKSLQ